MIQPNRAMKRCLAEIAAKRHERKDEDTGKSNGKNCCAKRL